LNDACFLFYGGNEMRRQTYEAFLQALDAELPQELVPDEPLADHLVDRLLDILLIADDMRQRLHVEAANSLLWVEPHLDHVCQDVDTALRRLAN
jgi:hypothetical protein